ncbi:RDD family protein [Streptomyces litchfieldiae]|uniref:RDD family protein n=1 Tax=Streptomyces litchfieldiae TaxID=3075543 RepID=A0ABU2MPI6_9ACTN|nr:RDD family protein [Streptomyces sp. DSM 44938]MDT0342989.1 RDD family protein [Streptomyces sp. DSM 44938]
MSTEQPPPGPGDGPEKGPFPADEPGLPKAPPPGDTYGANPYGDARGAVDPLAGMPPLAPLGRRLVARIVDALIVGIPVTLLLWPLMGDWNYDGNGGNGGYGQQTIVLLVYFVYEGLMLSARGQTLGKMLMRVRVGMLDNGAVPRGAPAWMRAAVYSLPQLVPCVGFLFWVVNALFCTWDKPYRQCLHDKAAKTVVVSAA